MSTWSIFFREAHVRRLQEKRHKKCPVHKKRKHVCEECLRIVCDLCGHKCAPIDPDRPPPPPKPKRTRKPRKPRPLPPPVIYKPTLALKAIWDVLAPLGALAIEPHVDSGQWMAIFPKDHFKLMSASELADRLWQDPKLRMLAKPTAFLAGRLIRPERWWVSFELKKKGPINGKPIKTANP